MRESRIGGKLRRLRRERGLTQVQMAEALGISASYLNLLEHNQRPVTVPVLLKLAQNLSVDIAALTAEDDGRLVAELMEAFADPLFDAEGVKAPDVRDLAAASPELARAVAVLYRAYRKGRAPQPDGAGAPADESPAGIPSEEVSDFIQQRRNHFPELELAAEALWRDARLDPADLPRGLAGLLAQRFAVDVTVQPAAAMRGMLRHYDPTSRKLTLSEMLSASGRAFQLAHQAALLGARAQIERAAAGGKFTSADAESLARVALANYVAAAVLMPYDRFLAAARSVRYDIEVLQHRFGTSFEQVCHRFTTLARPGAEGVSFHLIRVDIAGNISKRFSASGIRIARFGAACPRWNVYDAFATPGMIRIQASRMPDGAAFFCLARTVSQPGRAAGWGSGPDARVGRLAIGIGCPLAQARDLVYADGLDLDDPQRFNPIGISCRVCERADCPDRAAPSLHHRVEVDENRRSLSAYMHGP